MAKALGTLPDAETLAGSVGFDLVGRALGRDVEAALNTALAGGAVFAKAGDALAVFREALCQAIRAIQTHQREPLFQEFLAKGPYDSDGPIPHALRGKYLSDCVFQ